MGTEAKDVSASTSVASASPPAVGGSSLQTSGLPDWQTRPGPPSPSSHPRLQAVQPSSMSYQPALVTREPSQSPAKPRVEPVAAQAVSVIACRTASTSPAACTRRK